MLAALALAAAMDVTVVAADRSEVRVRDSGEPTGVALDLETTPSLGLRAADASWELEGGYSLRATERGAAQSTRSTDLVHRGVADVAYHDRSLRISAREEFVYGSQSFVALALASPTTGLPRLEALTVPVSFLFSSTRSVLSTRVVASRRVAVRSSFEFVRLGGVDAAARAVFPMQQGPRVEEAIDVLATRVDRLVTALSASRLVFSSGPESTLFEGSEALRHAFDRRTVGTARGGVVVGAGRAGGGAPLVWTPWLLAELGLTHELPDRVNVIGLLRVAPVVDRLSGFVDERAEASAAARWTFTPAWEARVEAGVAQSLPRGETARSFTLLLGEVGLRWRATRSLALELGTRSAWQRASDVGAAPTQWVAFAAATFTTDPLSL